ncbi:Sb-PDE family phosphodiesterase [Parapedobacter sp. DT-150]|uniref:Sb-PDE family phosphodiesterase n=1 Tax=Parapedobacter sp. DT-150 TaxID=3396162 RepID=UPI003F193C22
MEVKKIALVMPLLAASIIGTAQDNGMFSMREFAKPKKREIVYIPDVNGYQVLKVDFHMHTVFSDGHVWPNVRVQEAWNEGLDAIAYTEHVEYTPHKADVKVDNTRSYELAETMAAENNIILVRGTEITRNTPPGHFNALFIGDASGYIADNDSNKDKEAIMKAASQDAFIFWNHPGWKVNSIDGSYEWIDFVDNLHQEGILGGIEVFNGLGFHKKALDWAMDKGLTVMGTSDIHNLIAHDYDLENEYVHRTMTLVLAKERSATAIREALEAGRTVAWSSKYLAGREEHIIALFDASVAVSAPYHTKTGKDVSGNAIETNYYEIKNNSDLYFELALKSGEGTQNIVLYPSSSQTITAGSGQSNLQYELISAYIRSDKHPTVTITLK